MIRLPTVTGKSSVVIEIQKKRIRRQNVNICIGRKPATRRPMRLMIGTYNVFSRWASRDGELGKFLLAGHRICSDE
jgi:hypothetical protein